MRRFIYYNAASVGATLLLDVYPATAAYSLRLLRTAYSGSCIRVRRSSDNAEQDIGFSGVGLDTTSLLSFVGIGNGFVTKFYNQGAGGSSNDFTQIQLNNQPRIVASGNIETKNGEPIVNWYPNNVGVAPMNIVVPNFLLQTAFFVGGVYTQNTVNYILGDSVSRGLFTNGTFSGINGLGGFDGSNTRSSTGEDLNEHLDYVSLRSTDIRVARDGNTENNLGSFGDIQPFFLMGRSLSAIYSLGWMKELILYSTDESANKTAIESNINSYYGIYP